MNILNIEHISKVFGDKTIFDDASVGLAQGDKAGIVGINGTGKTTLLRMVAGLETPMTGQVVMSNGIRLAYLPQKSMVFQRAQQSLPMLYRETVRRTGECRVI